MTLHHGPGVRTGGKDATRPAHPRVRPAGWWFDVLLLLGFVVVSLALTTTPAQRVDLAIRDAVDAHRPPAAHTIANTLNFLGSGGALTLIALAAALYLVWRTRSIWPIAPVVATFALTVVITYPLKWYFDRAAPHSIVADPQALFSGGESYPSGHAVNTIVWYGVLCLLLAVWLTPTVRRWTRLVPPIVVTVTATYLGYHWLSDMLAGLLLGLLIERGVTRTPWPMVSTRIAPTPGGPPRPPR